MENRELERGNLDLSRLPREIEGLFASTLRRFENTDEEEGIADILGVLTVAKEGLSAGEIAKILGLKRRETGRILRHLREFLIDNEKRYSIFHRKFLDFLSTDDEYGFDEEELETYHRKIIAYCEPYQDQSQDHYAFRHLVYHYFDVGDFDGIARLAETTAPKIRQTVQDCLLYHFGQKFQRRISMEVGWGGYFIIWQNVNRKRHRSYWLTLPKKRCISAKS